MRWWGWGDDEGAISLPPAAEALLRDELGIEGGVRRPVALEEVRLPDPDLPAGVRERLVAVVGEGGVREERETRVEHAFGKSYPDLVRIRSGDGSSAPDAVVSPSSTDDRLARTVAACRGWVYATSVMGVTGARTQTSSAAPALVSRIRAADPSALIGVGLGVSDGTQAREVTAYADAVVVGSALVKTLLEADDAGRPADLSGLRALVADLAEGVRGPERELTPAVRG